ncbi:hypothetical protein C1702_04530 [Caldimonas thermodepolymerans]|nr:hypothetical protein C1702_04530 [Caldimonas thermodepolymerans]
MGEIAKARRLLLVNMFSGTKLKYGSKTALKTGKGLVSDGKSIYQQANKLAKAGKEVAKVGSQVGKTAALAPGMKQMIEDFIVQCADVQNIQEIVEVVTSETVKELIAEVTPIVGVVSSGYKLAQAARTVATDGYQLYRSQEYRQGFRVGDPVAAAEAVRELIKRDLGRHSVQLAQQATATGAKIAGLFTDLGTATTAGIGIANAVASLGLKLYSLGMDIKDLRAGNARLKTPDTLDLTVFKDCPILGCYLLTCADTSLVANFFVADIGLPGWMDRIEVMKRKQMDPLLEIATKNIKASNLQLEGLQANRITHADKSFFAKVKSKAVKRLHLS